MALYVAQTKIATGHDGSKIINKGDFVELEKAPSDETMYALYVEPQAVNVEATTPAPTASPAPAKK